MPKSIHAVLAVRRVRDLFNLVAQLGARRGLSVNELCGWGRTQRVSPARQESGWRLRHPPERCYSLIDIARISGRHHTSIMAGIEARHRRLNPPPNGDGNE
jgi:hypothetical protein